MAAESNRPKGLSVFHALIQQISGPVSMYYLKPKDDAYEAYRKEGITLPLVLLFGDRHYSREGACQPCTEPTCTTLTGRPWIHVLEGLGTVYPIDFFTETAPFMERIGQQHRADTGFLFHDFFKKFFMDCRDPSKRNAIDSTCPTGTIRWHHADARFMPSTAEGYLYGPLFNQLYTVLQFRSKFTNHLPLLPLERMYHVKSTNHPKAREYYVQTNEWLKSQFPAWLNEPTMTSFILRAMKDILVHLQTTHRTKRESAIFKQLDGMKGSSLENISFWMTLLSTYLERNPPRRADTFFTMIQDEALKENVIRYLQAIPILDAPPPYSVYPPTRGVDATTLYQALEEFVKEVWMPSMQYLLDIYTLLRMVKPPRNALPGMLTIGFFGNAHATFMAHALYTMGYTVVSSTTVKEQPRCQTVAQRIPLAEDLQAQLVKRLRTSEEVEAYTAYQKWAQERIAHRDARIRYTLSQTGVSLPASPASPASLSALKRKANTMNRKNNKNIQGRKNNNGNNRTKKSKTHKGGRRG